jgi:hypothetical protein
VSAADCERINFILKGELVSSRHIFFHLVTLHGHYRVRIYGQWFVVPDEAVVTEPNRFGPAVVWPYNDRYGNTQIRCFMPGAGT